VKVQEALQALRSALLKVYIERGIDCELVASERCLFHGDREDLTEIAGNLLDNAFKWCRSKIRISAEPVISLTARRDGLQIVVEDDGPGVPAHERAHILERGARLDERVSGQGIGLSVVKELAQLHGGTVHLEDSQLGGARVVVTIPPM
jgi:two-component system sensor histidine kinase PhoQ